MLKKSKMEYFSKYFQEHKRNVKKVWGGIRCAMEWHKTKNSAISSVTDTSGNVLTCPRDISQSFADYFKHIPHKCVSKIPKGLGKPKYDSYLSDNYSNCMVMYPTDPTEVYNIINTLKQHSSPGPLTIPNTFIKLLSPKLKGH